MEIRTPDGRGLRAQTWSEREHLEGLRESGVQDVYVEPADAPQEFWNSIMVACDYHLLSSQSVSVWTRAVMLATGWEFTATNPDTFEFIVKLGRVPLTSGTRVATAGERIMAIEHMVDAAHPGSDFAEVVNDRARWFRVGIRLEGERFVPITSEHIHQEVVRPTLLLLAQPMFDDVNELYRKAFDRALADDPSGAITAATSAVQQMFRQGLQATGGTLKSLAQRAYDQRWITPVVQQFVVRLDALRDDSDAHTPGTRDIDVATLALHLTASILLHLGRTGPYGPLDDREA